MSNRSNQNLIVKTLSLLCLISMLSCNEIEHLGNRVSSLEDQVSFLETQVGDLNAKVEAVSRIVSGGSHIKDVIPGEYGYSIIFADGTVCKVVHGEDAPAVNPLLSIDEQGQWLVSTDGGRTYESIEGASNAFSKDGSAPVFKVVGIVWMMSVDGGLTWTELQMSPCEAAAFFKSIEYDSHDGVLSMVLSDGRLIKAAVEGSFGMEINGLDLMTGCKILSGETRMFEVTTFGVADIFPQIPSGWVLKISSDSMSVTAPEPAVPGTYQLYLTLVSHSGLIKNITLMFTI